MGAQIAAQKAELECQVNETIGLYEQEQDSKNEVAQVKKRIEGDVMNIKRDLEDLDLQLQKLNQEKETKDHQIRVSNDEIAHQEEVLNKINREKKHLQEINAKNTDEFSGSEDRAGHLLKVKAKLEQTLDELNDSLEREKKMRN